MEFFSERRLERNLGNSNYYTATDNTVTLNSQLNGEIGFSIRLENRTFGVTHVMLQANTNWRGGSSNAPTAKLSFYTLPRTIRGRSGRASQLTEWKKLTTESVNITSGELNIVTFNHSDLVSSGLKPHLLIATVSIAGNSPAGSVLTVSNFRKATQQEVTDAEIEDEAILLTVNEILSLTKSNQTTLVTKLDSMDGKLNTIDSGVSVLDTKLVSMDKKLDQIIENQG